MIRKLTTIGCLGVLLSISTVYAQEVNKEQNEKKEVKKAILHTGKILEIRNSGSYDYIKLEKENERFWAAITKTDIKVGDKITLKESTWMKNFTSKTLNITFDKILFAEIDGQKKAIHGIDNVHGIHGQIMKKEAQKLERPNPNFGDITVSKEEAIKASISELYDNKDKLKNKNVEVQGDVIQISNKVMGNTWIKIYNGKDAVIFRSTNEDEKIEIGDKVKVIGTLNTDVDYGYGFKYEVIGVNAKFTKLN